MEDASHRTGGTSDTSWLSDVRLVRFPSDAKGEMTAWRVLDLLAGEGELDRINRSPPPPRGVDPQLYTFVNTLASCEWSSRDAMHDAIMPLLPRLTGTDGGEALRKARSDYFLRTAAVEYVPRVVTSLVERLTGRGKDCGAAGAALAAFIADPSDASLRELAERGAALRVACDSDAHAAQAAVYGRFFDDHGDPRDKQNPESSYDGLREALEVDADHRDAVRNARWANLVWYVAQELLDARSIAVESHGDYPGLSAYCVATIASLGGDELMKAAAEHVVTALGLTDGLAA